MSSAFSMSDRKRFAVTAIVQVWRRPQFLERMITALVNQSFAPTEIWVLTFASPKEAEFQTLFQSYRQNATNSSIPIKFLSGDMNLKYFGRMQLGLAVQTPYTMYFDDDCIPNWRFIELNLHVLNIPEYRGILSVKGHVGDSPPTGMRFFGPLGKTQVIKQLDVPGGTWALETSLTQLLFHELRWTVGTGEDYQIGFAVRKYTNLRTFVLPIGVGNYTDFNGFSPDYLAISAAGDSTREGGNMQLRFNLSTYLHSKGADFVNVRARITRRLLFLLDREADALWLYNLLDTSSHRHLLHFGITILITGRNNFTLSGAKELFDGKFYSPKIQNLYERFFIIDMEVGRQYTRADREEDIVADVLKGVKLVLRTANPRVMIPSPLLCSFASLAGAMSAKFHGIPLVFPEHSQFGEESIGLCEMHRPFVSHYYRRDPFALSKTLQQIVH